MPRILIQKIENYIDQRVGPQLVLRYADTRPQTLFLLAVKAMVGIHEDSGPSPKALIQAIRGTVSDPEGAAWCMSFIQTAVAYAEQKTSRSAKLPFGDNCLKVFAAAKEKKLLIDRPDEGDLIFWQHGDTTEGHVGSVIEAGDQFFRTVEGNTTNSDKTVARLGNGVFTKLRGFKGIGDMKVVGFCSIGF